MQWTVHAAEIDGMRRNRLPRLCKFVFFVCACTMDVSLPHPTVKRRFLVSKSAIEKLVLIYVHKKEKRSQCSSCSSRICHVLLSCSPFCHVLSGAISIIRELVLVRMYTFSGWRHLSCSPVTFSCHVLLFVMFSLADTKSWRVTSTSSTHHHDESLLL